MKKKSVFVIALLLICSLSMAVPAYAATNASDQIAAYFMDAGPTSDGQIAVEFSITSPYEMAVLGAKTIIIYKNNGSSWSYVDSFTQNDDGMTRTDAFHYGNTIYYDGEVGTEYRIFVKVFAEDSSGASDSRTDSFYVTAE